MSKHRVMGRTKLARAIGLILAGAASADASAQAAAELQEIEIVVVTGSYIRGTAEDAALPVDVVTADDLAKQGSPTMVDLVKSIPAVQAVAGESNQFGAGQTTGASNINLRGLGATRTLVLMNGRRMAPSANRGIGVDTNLIPSAAIGRIEVLKDGAAATYGSDAIGGVVNFITRKGFEGFSVDGSYSYIEGSDGDYGANLVWGHDTGNYDVLLTAGYRHRSELSTTDRDWAVNPRALNPQGGWSSFGNPGTYIAGATRFVDPACTAVGGEFTVGASGPQCFFQYITFDNLVEIEDHYQAYGEFNTTFGDSVDFHVEAFYGAHDVEEENSSPAYAPNQGFALTAGRTSAPNYFIPIDNPGLQALLPFLSQAERNAIAAAAPNPVNGNRRSIVASGLLWRPFGNGGNPLTGEGKQDQRNFEAYRVSTSLSGQFAGDIGWDLGVTYMEGSSDIRTPDILVSRLQRALSGFGGPNCTGATPGVGDCMYLNPFSTGYSQNPSTGFQNPAAPVATFTPSTVNDRALVDWLFEDYAIRDESTLFAVDLVFNGDLGFSIAGGENLAWAFGGQYREDGIGRKVNDFSDINVNPCPDTPITGNTNCPNGRSGAFSFFGPLSEQDLSQDVFGVFGELSVPLGQSLLAQVALRYEDYGGSVGSTTNPKLSMRWQMVDWLALRGSVGSTFRGPPQNQLLNGSTTGLVFTAQSAGYKPYDTFGNPNLKPEEADTFNVGFILSAGGFKATVDYWSFDFTDRIDTEGGTRMVDAFFGPQGTAAQDHCGEADYAALQARFQFAPDAAGNATCGIGTLIRTRVNTINSSDTEVTGIDAAMTYTLDGVMGGALTFGLDATYNLKYEIDDLFVEGILVEPGDDYAGTRGGPATIPELRGSVYVDFATAQQGIRVTSRYIDGVEDSRTSVPVGSPGKNIGSFLTYDLVYRLELPAETTLSASVFNVTDEDPPFVRLDLSYDPFIGNPLGRYYKMTLAKRF